MSGSNANFRNTASQRTINLTTDTFRGSGNPPFVSPAIPPFLVFSCKKSVSNDLVPGLSSFYRTGDVITNQLYYARIGTVELDFAGPVEVNVTAVGFTPFVTLVKDADTIFQSTDGSGILTATLTEAQTGPYQIEVTSVEPYGTGTFNVSLCYCDDFLHMSFDTPNTFKDDINQLEFGGFNLLTVDPGKLKQSLKFVGANPFDVDELFNVDDVSELVYNQHGFSMCFWIKFNEAGSNDGITYLILTIGFDNDPSHRFIVAFPGLVVGEAPGTSHVEIDSDPFGSFVGTRLNIPFVRTVGQWIFYAFSYDETSHTIRCSVNGGAFSPAYTSSPAYVMSPRTCDSIVWLRQFFIANVEIDEFSVFFNRALSENDITYLYNDGDGRSIPFCFPP